MKVCYNENFNFDLGLLRYLHPFDGVKFRKVYRSIKPQKSFEFIYPETGISQSVIIEFVDPLIKRYLNHKEHLFRALEVPSLPFIGMSFLEEKILSPMRWGVAGTLLSTETAISEGFCWNLSGGYHHASPHSIEGFCIYNDIGITYQELIKAGKLSNNDKILIIDTDAHHGNGNARTFYDNDNITLLDVYNKDIYPSTPSTRQRVNIPVPLSEGVGGTDYLTAYQNALKQLSTDFKVAFVVAGTDVLSTDKLGGMQLTIEDVVAREKLTIAKLNDLGIPTVMLSGGGYSKQSAEAITQAMSNFV